MSDSTAQSSPRRKWLGRLIKTLLAIITASGLGWLGVWLLVEGRLQEGRKFRILVPLYASSQEYLNFMGREDGKYPKDQYKRKIALDTIYAIDAAKKYWFKNPPQGTPNYFREGKVDFYYYPEGYDETSYGAAFDKAMTIAKKEGYEVIAVIGHVTSSVTRACGKLYGEQKLPIILPLSTATDLPSFLKGTCKVPAVLRLPPPNAKQAELVASFLSKEKKYKVIIAKDLSNPAYSDDWIDGFRDAFVRQPFEKVGKEKEATPNPYSVDHGRILAVIRGGESGNAILDPIIRELNVDAFIMVGMTEFTLETLAQARASNLQAQYTILTDGAVDEYLLPRINRLISDPYTRTESVNPSSGKDRVVPQLGRVYMAFPLESPLPQEIKPVLDEMEEKRDIKLTHAQYVIDAALVVLTALDQGVVESGYSWMKEAKAVIADEVEEWNSKREIDVRFPYDNGRRYRLDGAGNTSGINYHLYYANLPGLGKEHSGIKPDQVEWIHDEKVCPIHPSKQLKQK